MNESEYEELIEFANCVKEYEKRDITNERKFEIIQSALTDILIRNEQGKLSYVPTELNDIEKRQLEYSAQQLKSGAVKNAYRKAGASTLATAPFFGMEMFNIIWGLSALSVICDAPGLISLTPYVMLTEGVSFIVTRNGIIGNLMQLSKLIFDNQTRSDNADNRSNTYANLIGQLGPRVTEVNQVQENQVNELANQLITNNVNIQGDTEEETSEFINPCCI